TFAIGDVDPILIVDCDIVGPDKLAGVDAGLAPGQKVTALGAVLVQPRVAVAVADVNGAGHRRDRGVRGAVEWLAAPLLGGLVPRVEGSVSECAYADLRAHCTSSSSPFSPLPPGEDAESIPTIALAPGSQPC